MDLMCFRNVNCHSPIHTHKTVSCLVTFQPASVCSSCIKKNGKIMNLQVIVQAESRTPVRLESQCLQASCNFLQYSCMPPKSIKTVCEFVSSYTVFPLNHWPFQPTLDSWLVHSVPPEKRVAPRKRTPSGSGNPRWPEIYCVFQDGSQHTISCN